MDQFETNKYTKWYYDIIHRAKNRLTTEYTEKHHIVPKSLGGSNRKDNLVSLTAREHYVCHLLLTKMTTGSNRQKMIYGLWLMCNRKNKSQLDRVKPSSRIYSNTRREYISQIRESQKGVKKTYKCGPKKHKPETIQYFREIKLGSRNPNYGVTQKPEWNKAKSDSQIGIPKPKFTCEVCNLVVGGKSNYERWHGANCKKSKVIL